ncbi:signal transduction histidine kinase [Halarchaeum rubridurum]|uniref:histidine kinase n=1 Tax=Halarchaeum rubridurum TaxID=489911 RepID=A0A830FSI6_9EURY|nr:histidine kinase N-terminal 7TM domain-containing protein [Halarchaeum rubridurum]MBP1953766.1 signal transduction histidine kinase [Halarchaeum rubridurum]GGM54523.1 hypothetical protein GCM10009017_01060 [Halarchaeum rubridurum]
MNALSLSIPLVAVGSFAAAFSLLLLTAYLLAHRGRPSVDWFVTTLAAQSLGCLSYSVGMLVTVPAWRVAFEVMSVLAFVWIGYFFLGFALEYTGRVGANRWSAFAALAVPPFAGSLLLLTSSYHGLFWSDFALVRVLGVVALDYTLQSGALAVFALDMAYVAVGVYLLVETIRSYGPLYRSEAVAVALSTVPVGIGFAVWILDLGPASTLIWAVPLSLPHAALDAYAFVGKQMFDASPKAGRVADEQAIDALPDPVVVVDDAGRIVDANAAALDVFLDDGANAVGRDAADALDVDLDALRDGDDCSIDVTTDDRRYVFAVHRSPLVSGDTVVGHTLLFRDVTAQHENEQRLEVFNRVLRHNLRNKLTTVLGSTAVIEDEAENPKVRTLAANARESSEALADIGEKARRFDRLRSSDLDVSTVAVDDVVTGVVEEFDARAALAARVPDGLDVTTDRRHLAFALENVVENAVEHANEPDPAVEIDASVADGDEYAVVVAVRDEGPGIPEAEIEVLTSGTESDLEHGSGLGLWIVLWCLRRLGGEVTFDATADGTTVRLWLPETTPVDARDAGRVRRS